jgi:uncharacterized membrane protein YgcG
MDEFLGFIAVPALFIAVVLIAGFVSRARTRGANRRQEALFVSSFPELQPHFHPERVLAFVGAWKARVPRPEPLVWKKAPGFGGNRVRLLPRGEKGQPAELLDAADTIIASFVLQDHADGGVIRIDRGKLTINVRDAAVRYWHPQREFKWSRAKGWRVINSLSERGIDSNDRGTSFSDSSSSSSTATAAAAAVAGAAVVTGAGGAFDGGGSSSSWDAGAESRTSY